MPVRVLHYVGKMNRGGMETFIMNLYRKIDREKIQFDFAVHGNIAGDFAEEIESFGGKFYYFPQMRQNPMEYRKAWRNFWKENSKNYIVFHMHTNSLANIIALEEATRVNVPIRIVHSHSSMANKGRLQRLNDFLHKRNLRRLEHLATNLFSCSDKAAQWLFGGNEVGNLQVQQIKNGVDTESFKFDLVKRNRIREELNIEKNKVIGHIGAFLPVKNHKFLLEIIEQAYRKDNSIRCILIGDGELRSEMESIVSDKKLEDVILFLGKCDNVNEMLSAMDVFLMPSLYEGLPVCLVEVQTNGLPALVSDSITKDVELKDNLCYYDLSKGAELWANQLLEILSNEKRDDNIDNIIRSGFDIKETVCLYEKIIMKGGNMR